MKKRTFYILIAVIAILGIVSCANVPRYYLTRKLKLGTVNTYAINNVKTGMNIRPYNAGINDGTKIIQYTNNNWECMTWQFIKLEDSSFLLKNLWNNKTFQPSSSPQAGVFLHQQPIEANSLQYWEFIKRSDETYLIRLKGTELYITVTSDKKNSEIILMPNQNSSNQQWKLIEQHPTK
jgi:hypothetical protein